MGFSIGSVFSGIGDFLGITGDGSSSPGGGIPGLWDRFKNGRTNEYNERMTRETNQLNKEIADQNLAFQRENLDYQKALQEKIFEREDSAYQRTASDMRAAGLNPLVMNGTNGAGEAISINPLHNDMNYQAPQHAFSSGSPLEALSSILDFGSKLEGIKSQKLQNKFADETMEDRIDSERIKRRINEAESIIKDYETSDKQRKETYNSFFGLHDGMSESEKIDMILNKIFNQSEYSDEDSFYSDSYKRHIYRYGKIRLGHEAGDALGDVIKEILPFGIKGLFGIGKK